MAYYDPTSEENQDPNGPQQAQIGPESGVISGQGSAATTSTPSSTNAPNAPDKPGNFVGIQQYLEQNKPQSASLAKDVGSYVNQQGQAASDALAQGQGQFDQAVDQSTVKLNQGLFDEAKATPDKVAADAQKKADFQKMRDAQYQGPSSLENSDYYQPINLAVQNALGTAKNTESAQGRTELLTDLSKQKNERVSRGASNLDAALLSASPDSRQILQQARDQVNPLGDRLSAITAAEDAKVKAAQDQTAKTQAAVQQAFSGSTGVQGQLEQSLQQKANQAVQSAGSDQNAIMDLLKSGNPNISDHQLQILGLTRTQYNGLLADQQYYKSRGKQTTLSDLGSFATLQRPQNQISPQNIASADDYAKYQALNDLMGTSNGFLSDPSQAGKANLDTVNFRYADTPNALADRINNATVRPLMPSTQAPISIPQIAQAFSPGSAVMASLPYDIAVNRTSNSTPEQKGWYRDILQGLTTTLGSVNKAYGTEFKVPQAYIDSAMKESQAAADKFNSNAGMRYPNYKNVQAGWDDIVTGALIQAYSRFLNAIKDDPSKVRV